MSLFDGLPLESYTPPPIAPASVYDLHPCRVTLKRASNGEEIMLCSVSPPPDHIKKEARERKLPLFTFDEIPAMRSAAADDPRYIDTLIAARRLFGWGGSITHRMETP